MVVGLILAIPISMIVMGERILFSTAVLPEDVFLRCVFQGFSEPWLCVLNGR